MVVSLFTLYTLPLLFFLAFATDRLLAQRHRLVPETFRKYITRQNQVFLVKAPTSPRLRLLPPKLQSGHPLRNAASTVLPFGKFLNTPMNVTSSLMPHNCPVSGHTKISTHPVVPSPCVLQTETDQHCLPCSIPPDGLVTVFATQPLSRMDNVTFRHLDRNIFNFTPKSLVHPRAKTASAD